MRKAILLLSLLAWPSAASAQRYSLSLYTGVRAPFTSGFVDVASADGTSLFALREQRGGGAVLGLDGDVAVGGPFRVVGGAAYSGTGEGEFFLGRDAGWGERGDFAVRYTSATWLAKLGAGVRVRGEERTGAAGRAPSLDLTVGPAAVHQLETTSPALNFGFGGILPMAENPVEFNVGIEDYFVFWNHGGLEEVMLDVVRPVRSDAAAVDFLYRTSNLVVVRVGASYRF